MLGKSFPRVTTAVFIYKICVLKGLRIKLRNIWATFVETLSPRCFKMAQSSHSDGRKLSSSALHVYDNLGTTPSSFLDSIKVIAKCTLLLRNSYLFLFIFTEQIEIDEFISEQSICLCCKNKFWWNGCGSVDRVVVSNARGPQFKSNNQQNFITNLFTVNCWKDDNKAKEACDGSIGKSYIWKVKIKNKKHKLFLAGARNEQKTENEFFALRVPNYFWVTITWQISAS